RGSEPRRDFSLLSAPARPALSSEPEKLTRFGAAGWRRRTGGGIINPPSRRVSLGRRPPRPHEEERRRVTNREPPLTRPTLVGALREGLRWEEFVALYG